jgi:hypothetical protein
MAVYFIAQGEGGPIKIGYTTKKATWRLSELQVASPQPLVLLAVIQGDREVEVELHTRFADLRIRGEWFERGDALMDFIEDTSSYAVLYEMRQAGLDRPESAPEWLWTRL